jgi:A/G-specific adenine glycosylase
VSRFVIPPASALLTWYDRHRRALPWRAGPGELPDPYRVWLSEIMLQQTTVAAAIPYYENFVRRFPGVRALARAPLEAVLVAWAGLGYYARARNLHACARQVAEMDGFPRDPAALLALPGIGPYTATAIAAIAFGIPGVPVDGNVERVTARIFAIDAPLPGAKPALRAAAESLGADPAARARPSDFAQALFDLGATLCTPTRPACGLCPWTGQCAGRRAGIAAELPRKVARTARPVRYGAHFWLTDAAGRVLLRRRKPEGLLGGMTELPGTDWRATPWAEAEALGQAPAPAAWRKAGEVRHVFTHFELRLTVFAAAVKLIAADGFLHPADALDAAALPSVMRKCVRAALDPGARTPHSPPKATTGIRS